MSILKFKNSSKATSYLTVSVLGKSLKLNIKYINISNIELNKKENEIDLLIPKSYKKIENIQIINLAIRKLYNQIASTEIEYAMEIARHILKFAPEDYKIERINDSFCKCKNKVIIVNPDIVQYSKEVINTTIIQAFCKIKFKQNSAKYKESLSYAMEKYKEYKYNNFNSNIFIKSKAI